MLKFQRNPEAVTKNEELRSAAAALSTSEGGAGAKAAGTGSVQHVSLSDIRSGKVQLPNASSMTPASRLQQQQPQNNGKSHDDDNISKN